jgi:hypothetical protein
MVVLEDREGVLDGDILGKEGKLTTLEGIEVLAWMEEDWRTESDLNTPALCERIGFTDSTRTGDKGNDEELTASRRKDVPARMDEG